MVAPQEVSSNLDKGLLSPDARETVESLIPPQFDNEHRLAAGNFSVYFIGSSPSVPVHFESPNVIETWTQLPKRSEMVALSDGRIARAGFLENMYVQFSEGIPGVVVDTDNEKIWVDPNTITEDERYQVNADWLVVFEGVDPNTGEEPTEGRVKEALGRYAISPEYAWGLYHLRDSGIGEAGVGVKGHMTGLYTWGIQATDSERRPIIYDSCYWDGENLGEVAEAMLLKGEWQRRFLAEINPNIIFHIDEPYLTQIGSSFISVSNVDELLRQQFETIKGNRGAHCCGQTEYEKLFRSSLDIISLDLTAGDWDGSWEKADFAKAFVTAAQSAGVEEFLERGGMIALGVVPYKTNIHAEQVKSHVLNIFAELENREIDVGPYINQFIITPTCGAGGESVEAAKHAFSSSVSVARELQEEFLLQRAIG